MGYFFSALSEEQTADIEGLGFTDYLTAMFRYSTQNAATERKERELQEALEEAALAQQQAEFESSIESLNNSIALVESGQVAFVGGTSPEGVMASADTLQTMRASGGFTIPEGLKSLLPLLLIFALVVLVIFKK